MKRKKLKKLLSTMLSASMCCMMTLNSAMPVYATEAGTEASSEAMSETEPETDADADGETPTATVGSSLTVENAVAGHKYKVYQIYVGNVNADGSTLSNVRYGRNYGEIGKAVPHSELEGITDAKAFAKNLASDNTGGGISGDPIATLTADNVSAELEPGYYLVMDESENSEHGDASSDFIVEIAGNATFSPKSTSVPTFDKIIEGEVTCDHVWAEEITKEATCTEEGEKRLTCGECGEIRKEVIPAGHDYEDGVCKNCGEEEPHILKIEDIVQNPDGGAEIEIEKGTILTTQKYAAFAVNDEPVLENTYALNDEGEYKITATDENGTTVIINITIIINSVCTNHVDSDNDCACDVCGGEMHEYVGKAYVPTSSAGSKPGSSTGATFSYNNSDEKTAGTLTIQKDTVNFGYSMQYEYNISVPKEGDYTVTINSSDNKLMDFYYIDDAMVVDGKEIHLTQGSHSVKVDVRMRSMTSYTDFNWSTTIELNAMVEWVCKKCGNISEHKYIEMITKEPTCAENGEKKLTCSECGDVIKTEIIPATGEHDYEETIIKEATCSEDGEKNLVCKTCGDARTEVIPTLAHADENNDCICDTCGEHAHTYVAKYLVPTVSLDSKSGSCSASVYNGSSSAEINYVLTGANASGTAAFTINIPVSGNYFFQGPSPMQDTGTGSGQGTGSSYDRTLDGADVYLLNTKYLTKGAHTYVVSITHKNWNSNTMTDESRIITSRVSSNVCSKCGYIEGEPEDTDVASISSVLPVSLAAEETPENSEAGSESAETANTDSEGVTEVTGSDTETTVKYGVGDSVPFRLTAVMPESISAYDKYKLIFHDTMSDGLTYDENSLKVFAGDTEINAENYSVSFSDGGQQFTVTINDVKAEPYSCVAGSVISVRYTATLNDAAAFRNINDAYLQYSNDPKGDGMGTTVSDDVTAFTFTVAFNKVDGKTNEALNGAGFTLYKKDSETGEYAQFGDEMTDSTAFSFDGLAVGDYKLVESTTPDGYNTMEDLEFSIVADSRENADGTAEVTALKIVAQGGTLESDGLEGWTASADNSTLTSNITNFKGSELPSTGGIGTTMFYMVGGTIVFAVCVLLVMKKKDKINGNA